MNTDVLDFYRIGPYADVCFWDENGPVTRKELHLLVGHFVKIIKNEKLVFACPDQSRQFIALYFACLSTETTIMLAASDLNADKLDKVIQNYSPSFIALPSDSTIEGYRRELSGVDSGIFFYKPLASSIPDKPACSLLLPTSGSTGSTKYVRLSLQNVLANTQSILSGLNMSENSRTLLEMPISYSYGLSVLNTSLASGGSVVFAKNLVTTKKFWEIAQLTDVNTLSGVPFYYDLLFKLQIPRMPKSIRLNQIHQAGGRLDVETFSNAIKVSKENEIEFCVMYGQTEAAARMAINRGLVDDTYPPSVGRAIEGGTFEICKSSLGEEEGVDGEIIYKGPNVMLGYASTSRDLYQGDDCNGVLYTGDLGYLDNTGKLHLTGRKSRFVKIAGFRISLDEIEMDLKKNRNDLAVTSFGEAIIVFFTDDSEKEIADHIGRLFPRIRRSFALKQIPKIPMTVSNKVNYAKLREFLSVEFDR
jgi:long-chain acyl-CoA synthetase